MTGRPLEIFLLVREIYYYNRLISDRSSTKSLISLSSLSVLAMIAGGTASAMNKNLETLHPFYAALSIIKGNLHHHLRFFFYS